MPVLSPLVILAFLGTTAGTIRLAGARQLFKIAAACTFALPAAYLATVLIFSLASHDKVLAPGQYKYFCEMDCHIAYAVLNVAKTKTLDGATAHGTFYVVTTKIWFDEKTIGPNRGNSPLETDPRMLITDEDGDWLSAILISHEKSLLHKKIWFQIGA